MVAVMGTQAQADVQPGKEPGSRACGAEPRASTSSSAQAACPGSGGGAQWRRHAGVKPGGLRSLSSAARADPAGPAPSIATSTSRGAARGAATELSPRRRSAIDRITHSCAVLAAGVVCSREAPTTAGEAAHGDGWRGGSEGGAVLAALSGLIGGPERGFFSLIFLCVHKLGRYLASAHLGEFYSSQALSPDLTDWLVRKE